MTRGPYDEDPFCMRLDEEFLAVDGALDDDQEFGVLRTPPHAVDDEYGLQGGLRTSPTRALLLHWRRRVWGIVLCLTLAIGLLYATDKLAVVTAFFGFSSSAATTSSSTNTASGGGLRGAADNHYVVVVDAGSTGSRAHVYLFSADKTQLLQVPGHSQRDVMLKVKPGLSTFADNISGIAGYSQPLIDFCHEAVPADRRAATPVLILATAGLRLVPEDKRNAILAETNRYWKESSGFEVRRVGMLGGAEEGGLFWISANFLTGGKQMSTVDLGGASVQISYKGQQPVTPAHHGLSYDLDDDGVHDTHLFSASFLGFGLMAAVTSILQLNKLSHPCLPPAYKSDWAFADHSFQIAGVAEGSASHDKCLQVVKEIFYVDTPCSEGNVVPSKCSFQGKWLGPGRPAATPLMAASFIYGDAKDAGLIGKAEGSKQLTPSHFLEKSKEVCALTHEQLLTRYGSTFRKDEVAFVCMRLTYIYSLLTDGFGLSPTEPVHVVQDIEYADSQETLEQSWCLGAALTALKE